ncbi:MAG TPA: glycoside hydrolase family 2 TIM barrel-domain containing protein, partial [Bacteroidales bacterium]|nr:glycoside hydrolase family 2 TIM barrel-domain containing protein [Bacteroidales bacterium]
AENGKGYDVTVNTSWTGDIFDRSYFTDDKYARYREPGNIKIPFWLKPVKYYSGVAWYQKEVNIPADWNNKKVTLFLERCHWETTLFVNGKKAGTCNSLATPHIYDLTGFLRVGKNMLTVRVDNRIIIPIGVNSHSISDHTQGNWNGIAGEISLRVSSPVSIDEVRIFPDIEGKKARVVVNIDIPAGLEFRGRLTMRAESMNSAAKKKLRKISKNITAGMENAGFIFEYPMGNNPQLWSEFNPALYSLTVELKDKRGKTLDTRKEIFGMREIKSSGTRLELNGKPIFLRGTTECCIFPLTGYPPSDTASWLRVMRILKEYGLNHMRFHSYCPPEAAFIAADITGIYLHVECSSWANQGSSIGYGGPVDSFIYQEGDRIIKEYGNHPSFCMLAYGNEPAGRNQNQFLGNLLKYWKSIDNRRVYTSAAGWPVIPENDYNLIPDPRIQHWGEGLKSVINSLPPNTMFDFRDVVSKYNIPVVGHEIGQWCVYPDFKEIPDYTGILKPTNFEIFKETLENNGMGNQAEDFLMASGKLQVLCYKADIEAALRTPGFAGFQMLQLHDFPGQGTALVGILNAFFKSKGYVKPEEFRMFCNETVPLARMEKMIYRDGEQFKASIEIAHFGREPIKQATIISCVKDKNSIIRSDSITIDELPVGNCIGVDTLSMELPGFTRAQKLTLEVRIKNSDFVNRWDFWVYPSEIEPVAGDVHITEKIDDVTRSVLNNGGRVLLLTHGKVAHGRGAEVAVGFSSIFWNTAWTRGQAPHTLGILCDPHHPVFNHFPTEYHSNYQWWDPVTHSQAMKIDGFPETMKPLIQLIDTWFENRRLALAFEAKCGNGKLLVCSINLKDSLDSRPVTKQLLFSMLEYMKSESFNPSESIE